MSAMEIVFASIRNHLSVTTSEYLQRKAFMELKCDLIPREALVAAKGFDERLRNSGEDQVLSFRLRQLGWEIVTTESLEITLRSGKQTDLRSNLRKSFLYGFTQAAVLREGARELVSMDIELDQGRARLMNRLLAVGSGLCLYAFIPIAILALAGIVPLIPVLVLASLPVVRCVSVMMRILGLRAKLEQRLFLALLTFSLCPIDDLVYTAAFGVGTMTRRPKSQTDS
jgi:hypothetical protein